MNDIITNFIGNTIAKKIAKTNYISSTTPITNMEYTKDELKHLNKCQKQICETCSSLLRGN